MCFSGFLPGKTPDKAGCLEGCEAGRESVPIQPEGVDKPGQTMYHGIRGSDWRFARVKRNKTIILLRRKRSCPAAESAGQMREGFGG